MPAKVFFIKYFFKIRTITLKYYNIISMKPEPILKLINSLVYPIYILNRINKIMAMYNR